MKARDIFSNLGCMAALTVLSSVAFADTAQADDAVLCMVLPSAQFGQSSERSQEISESLRSLMGAYLAGPGVELVNLDARIDPQIEREAVQKGCSYTLRTEFTKKSSSGGFLNKLAPLGGMAPLFSGGGVSNGAIAGQLVSSAASANSAASQSSGYASFQGGELTSIRGSDSIELRYLLKKPGLESPVLANKFKRKAKQDGEDLIGPLAELAATELVSEIIK